MRNLLHGAALSVAACSLVWTLWAAFGSSTTGAAPAEVGAAGRVYVFRGLAGVVFSRGMDRLAARIKEAGVTSFINAFPACGAVARQAIRDYRRDPKPITLIGHSLGGNCAITFAKWLKDENIPVNLVVTFDPTRNAPDLPFNIERYINIYKSNNVLGAGDVKDPQGFPGHYASFDLSAHSEITHINIDKQNALHEQILAKVLEIAATPPNTQGESVPIHLDVPGEAPIELWDSGLPVIVRGNETVAMLAATHQVPLWTLLQINQITDGSTLTPGQRVVVPRHLVPVPQSPQ